MSPSSWQLSRLQYSFCLGILVVISSHLRSPMGALIGYALASLVTALRFRTLGWRVPGAFIPLAIAVLGTALSALGAGSDAGASISKGWHFVALILQCGMSIRAGLSTAPSDPTSLRAALARDLLARRRETRQALRKNRPLFEAHRREVGKLSALNAELQAYVAAHGYEMTDEYLSLKARFEAQRAIVESLGVEVRAATDHLRARSTELKGSLDAWKDRDKNKAA